MKRLLIEKLKKWKIDKYRKPLIIRGVRQVGKTWLIKEFGNLFYENTAYFNFEEENISEFFINTKNVSRIIENLSIINKSPLLPEKTLIIFDEIQECSHALNSLKYFCENAPEYHIICAGSLLGVLLSKEASFPVGKVDFIDMNPMTFSEFLIADGHENLLDYLNSIDSINPILEIFFNQLKEKLKLYFITGGFPEPVKIWTQDKDVKKVDNSIKNILNSYTLDFSKHADSKEIHKLSYVWNSIPSQLSKENKKFLYNTIKEGARAREYENSINWLCNAGIIHKIYISKKPSLPLSAYDDLSSFKIYSVDPGLLRKQSFLDPIAFAEGNRLFTEFKGALTENFILSGLINQYENIPRYWTSEGKAEVDFIIQRENQIFPIECKSDENIISKSLSFYANKYNNQTPLKIRFSLKNLKLDGNTLNIPIFMIDQLDNLIKIALETI